MTNQGEEGICMPISCRKTTTGAATLATAAAIVVPTASAAATSPTGNMQTLSIQVSGGGLCKGKARRHVVRKYYRGPAIYRLMCGTKRWGYRHMVYRGRWNKQYSKKIASTVATGTRTTAGFARFSRTCPSYETFRVVLSYGDKGIMNAYHVNSARTARAC